MSYFATSWTAARQASLSFNISRSLLKLMSISQWCHPAISFSVVPFSSCLQSFPASGSFPVSQFFASGGQLLGDSASVLPMNIQGWFPLGLTGLISLQPKGLSSLLQPQSSLFSKASKVEVASVWITYESHNGQERFPNSSLYLELSINFILGGMYLLTFGLIKYLTEVEHARVFCVQFWMPLCKFSGGKV